MVDESVTAHFAHYDAFVESTRKWLGKRADRYHWYRVQEVLRASDTTAQATARHRLTLLVRRP